MSGGIVKMIRTRNCEQENFIMYGFRLITHKNDIILFLRTNQTSYVNT